MTEKIKIIIPDLEFVSVEQYQEILDKLEELPITYEIWTSNNKD